MRHFHRSRLAPILALTTVLFALTGCSDEHLNGFLPGFDSNQNQVTNNTSMVSGLWTTSWIVLLIVGIITWVLSLYAAIVYRRRKGTTTLPPQLKLNMPIEVFYTIVPLILVLGFFAFTWRDQDKIEKPFDKPDETIEIIAKQWAWDTNYVDRNAYSPGIQGRLDTSGDKGSLVESQLPTIYLPVNKKITLKLNARDVIHSFWVIDFLYKKDMFPGKTNYMYVTPTRLGTYSGKCAELCGEYHSLMLFKVKVVTENEYLAHIEDLKNQGYTGQLDSIYDRNQNLPGTKAPAAEKDK